MYSYWGFRFISLEKGDKIVVVYRDRFEESDRFVLDWYLRSSYKLFNNKSNLLIKKLEE